MGTGGRSGSGERRDGDNLEGELKNIASVSEDESAEDASTERPKPIAREHDRKRQASHTSSHRAPRGEDYGADSSPIPPSNPYVMDLTTNPYTGEACREPREQTMDIASAFYACGVEQFADVPDWTSM